MTMKSRVVAPAAYTAIFGLALSASVVAPMAADLTPAAQAQDAATTSVPASNIDFTKTGSITIHKRAGSETVDPTGNENASAPGTPPGWCRIQGDQGQCSFHQYRGCPGSTEAHRH